MSDFTEVITEGNVPYYSFFHANKEYLIYTLVDEDMDVSRMCLAYPYVNGSGVTVPYNVVAEYATSSILNNAGGTEAFMREIFLPKVNTYLAENGGTPDGDTFPIDGTVLEQFNFMVEKSISYVDGKIFMSEL